MTSSSHQSPEGNGDRPSSALLPQRARSRPLVRLRSVPDVVRSIAPVVVALVALAVYTNSHNHTFLQSANIQNILSQCSALALVAIGQTVLMAAGQFDLSIGAAVSLYGIVAARLLSSGASEPMAVLACIGMGLLSGLILGLIVGYLRVPPFILTLGALSIFSSVANVLSNGRSLPMDGFDWLATGKWLGIDTPIVVWVLVALVAATLLRYTRFGRRIFAVGSNEEAAYLAGIPARRTVISVFVIAGGLAGFAAIVLNARLGAGDPTGGSDLALQAIAAAVLGGAPLTGGRGSILGTACAVILLAEVGVSLLFLNVPGFYQDLVFGGVLVFAVVVTAIGDLMRRRRGFARRSLMEHLLRRTGAKSS